MAPLVCCSFRKALPEKDVGQEELFFFFEVKMARTKSSFRRAKRRSVCVGETGGQQPELSVSYAAVLLRDERDFLHVVLVQAAPGGMH